MNHSGYSWFAKTFKPAFLDKKLREQGPFKQLFSYRRLYRLSLLFMAWMALGPLTGLTIMGYFVTRNNAEEIIQCRLSGMAATIGQAVFFSIEKRKSALFQVADSHTLLQMTDSEKLSATLSRLNRLTGGFLDLTVINPMGIQVGHTASHGSEKTDYSREKWFQSVIATGTYLSDISFDSYSVPYMHIAVLQPQNDGTFYILRAAVAGTVLHDVMNGKQYLGSGDAFLVNRDGIIQPTSRYREDSREKINLPGLSSDSEARILPRKNDRGESFFEAYVDIPSTPFILVLSKPESALMQSWNEMRWVVFWFLSFSLLFIAILVYTMATRLVNEVYMANQQHLMTLREIEHSNKLASIGRLAAGVGHEINNPLQIISEKAELIQDIISFKEEYKGDQQLAVLVNSILTAVKRCGTITRRLLDFAGHLDEKVEVVNLKSILKSILDLLHKESEYRGFNISLDVDDDIPDFECDRGKLQQIFLNIINNSFAAMQDGGTLTITARQTTSASVVISFVDDGCGIPAEAVDHIFEPFFYTKSHNGGTGLGLSITHALVQEVGGSIKVKSEVDLGAEFTVEIPLPAKQGNESRS